MAAALLASVPAQAEAPASPTGATESPSATKDVVVDAVNPAAAPAPTAPTRTGGRLVPTPAAGAVAGATTGQPAAIYTSPVHDAAAAGALADLGLALMVDHSRASGNAARNDVLSPLSVALALGMVHAGAAGTSAREMSSLLAPAAAGDRMFSARIPSLLSRIVPKGKVTGPLSMASRVWVRKEVASAIPAPYAALVSARFATDAAVLSFDNPNTARQAINQWTAQQTRDRIRQLLPQGSVTATTKLVVTNAVHFKSPWAQPFDPAATESKPFQTPSGTKNVPTMVSERPVLQGVVDNLTVMELPFVDNAYSLILAMAPGQHTLNALETDLSGVDVAAWSQQLKPVNCQLEMPRFSIQSAARSLKPALQALGVRTLFTDQADLEPLLGRAAKGVMVDDVMHAATLVIDERGGEAAAATSATTAAKSFTLPAPRCAVDKPFVFAIVHKATGTPVFMGKVADPSASAGKEAS